MPRGRSRYGDDMGEEFRRSHGGLLEWRGEALVRGIDRVYGRGVATKTGTKRVRVRDRSGALYALVGRNMRTALDDWTSQLNAAPTGWRWSRTAVVRTALLRACPERGPWGRAP